MVLPLPVAETSTVLPETRLLNWSFRVTVIVDPAVLSTDREVGEAVRVEVVADPGPAVNVTTATLAKVILSVVSVAEMFLASALVDFIVAGNCPLASVVAVLD